MLLNQSKQWDESQDEPTKELDFKGSSNFKDFPAQTQLTGQIYLFKVNRKRCEISSRLTIKTSQQRHRRRSSVFIVYFENSHLFLVFLMLTWSLYLFAGKLIRKCFYTNLCEYCIYIQIAKMFKQLQNCQMIA